MAACCVCSCRTFVIIAQILLGLSLTSLCVYAYMFLSVMRMRETPFWAGVPLLIAGLLGVGFLFKSHSKSTCLFVIKVTSVVCASIAIFTCVTSLVFIVIHLVQLFTYVYCQHLTNGCLCFLSRDTSPSNARLYTHVDGCFPVFCQVKIVTGCIGGLCLLGAVAASAFVLSIWRSVYGSTSSSSSSTPPPSSSQEFLSPGSSSKFSSLPRTSRPVSMTMSTTENV